MTYGADLSFSVYQPTRVVFGDGAVGELGLRVQAARHRARDGRHRSRDARAHRRGRARRRRRSARASARIYDGVIPDTGVEVIDEGARIAREHGCDGLVSVGGGSRHRHRQGHGHRHHRGRLDPRSPGLVRLPRRQTPHIAVPTTAGTGSEVSLYIVVKDHARAREDALHGGPHHPRRGHPRSVGHRRHAGAAHGGDGHGRADPRHRGVHIDQPATRSPTGWRCRRSGSSRAICRAPSPSRHDKLARGQMLIAANIAGMAVNSTGVGLVHAMAHVVGARHGGPSRHRQRHLPAARHPLQRRRARRRYRDVAEALGVDARDLGDEMAGEAAAQAVAQLSARVGLPPRLRDVGVPESGSRRLRRGLARPTAPSSTTASSPPTRSWCSACIATRTDEGARWTW